MREWMSSMRALPMTFVIYLTEAALALVFGLPAALELTRSAPQGADSTADAERLEFLLGLGQAGRLVGATGLFAGIALWLLAPWLQMAWLSALSRRESVGESLVQGARLYVRAQLLAIPVVIGVALSLVPFGVAAWGISQLSASQLNDRVHDLGIACALAPGLPVLLAGLAWLDLARARALHEGPWTSAVRSLRAALQPVTILRALFFGLAGWTLFLLAQAPLLERLGGRPLVVLALQSAVLARLFLRSRWLADALTCAEASAGSRASEAYE
ncbi:MAG: hypothetical protein QM778_08395 [Myxococcales bacterium]